MGMDVYFNKTAAVAAGLVLRIERNGSDERIAEEQAAEHPDLDYIEWLSSASLVMDVPNANHSVSADVYEETVSVRANKWGSTYAPLTEWLLEHGISWGEHS